MRASRAVLAWIAESRAHPIQALAGFIAGMLCAISAFLLDEFASHQRSVLHPARGIYSVPPFVTGVFGILVLFYLLNRIPVRRRGARVLVMSCCLGLVVGILTLAIGGGLAGYSH